MTDIERNVIRYRREKGHSVSEIASSLGLSRNTVKSFCRRTGIKARTRHDKSSDKISYKQNNKCAECQITLTQVSKRKPRRFCSDHCRYQWWNRHRTATRKKKMRAYDCKNCGNQFYSYAMRKYCCHPCYIQNRFKGEQV